jgi:hypothetical protein
MRLEIDISGQFSNLIITKEMIEDVLFKFKK